MAELWAVTVFFGHEDRQKRHQNYNFFRERLHNQNVPLLTVELTIGEQEPLLSSSDSDMYRQYHSNSTLWHKECLLNLALDHLPEECRSIAWLDCDIVFLDPRWPEQAVSALREYKVLQLFESVFRTPENVELAQYLNKEFDWESVPYAFTRPRGSQVKGLVSVLSDSTQEVYTPGYAWAGRREVLEQFGFYDYAIVGGGDQLLADALIGSVSRPIYYYDNPTMRPSLDAYQKRVQAAVGSSLSFVPGRILHLNHGPWRQRRYSERTDSLAVHDFDPETDLRSVNGVLEWNTDKVELIRDVLEYFAQRTEKKSL